MRRQWGVGGSGGDSDGGVAVAATVEMVVTAVCGQWWWKVWWWWWWWRSTRLASVRALPSKLRKMLPQKMYVSGRAQHTRRAQNTQGLRAGPAKRTLGPTRRVLAAWPSNCAKYVARQTKFGLAWPRPWVARRCSRLWTQIRLAHAQSSCPKALIWGIFAIFGGVPHRLFVFGRQSTNNENNFVKLTRWR